MAYVGARIDVLEVLERAVAAFLDRGEEIVETLVFQRVNGAFNAVVLVEEVYGTEHGSVAEFLTQTVDVQHNVRERDRTERFTVEIARDGFHFMRDSRVFAREVGMVALCVDDTQRVTVASKIARNALDNGRVVVLEVDSDKSSYRASHLIHKSRGLAEVLILGELRYLRNLYGRYLPAVVQVRHNSTDKHLERRRA